MGARPAGTPRTSRPTHIADKTVLRPANLEEDAAPASRLIVAAGAKSVLPVEPAETARVRDQAFAPFAKNYDQVRRAVWYVRWDQGDADEYVPSLYAGRSARKSDETPAAEASPAENVTPPTAPSAPSVSHPAPDATTPADRDTHQVAWQGRKSGQGENYGREGDAVNYQETVSRALEAALAALLHDPAFSKALCHPDRTSPAP